MLGLLTLSAPTAAQTGTVPPEAEIDTRPLEVAPPQPPPVQSEWDVVGVRQEQPIPLNLDSIKALIHLDSCVLDSGVIQRAVYRVLIDSTGQVTKFKCIVPNPSNPCFSAAIEPHLYALRFTPALNYDGKPIACWIAIPFRYPPFQPSRYPPTLPSR